MRYPDNVRCFMIEPDHEEKHNPGSATIFRRIPDDGERFTITAAPVGAMWYCDWMIHKGSGFCRGPDGRSLAVKLPNGHIWQIDAPCNNCGKPGDYEHKCWCRHGIPPDITVDKNCNTCPAGAGSIQGEDWHGFLTNGILSTSRNPT